jgi:hypothetical protein
MRVFVAGATGVVGVRLLPELVRRDSGPSAMDSGAAWKQLPSWSICTMTPASSLGTFDDHVSSKREVSCA